MFDDYASMAMLELSEAERVVLRKRFEDITGGFDALEAYDDVIINSAAPLVSVLDLNNVLREDTAVKCFSREELLKNAPEQHDGYFQVPGAVDKG